MGAIRSRAANTRSVCFRGSAVVPNDARDPCAPDEDRARTSVLVGYSLLVHCASLDTGGRRTCLRGEAQAVQRWRAASAPTAANQQLSEHPLREAADRREPGAALRLLTDLTRRAECRTIDLDDDLGLAGQAPKNEDDR
jgi:hypothetical protein